MFGRVVVPMVDVERGVPKEVSGYCNCKVKSIHRLYSRCLENLYSLAPVSWLLTT